MIKSVRDDLFVIVDNIEEEGCDAVGEYFNLSKLVSGQPHNNINKKSGKGITVEAKFPLLVSKAIEYLCDIIPLTPEEFIVDIVTEKLNLLIDNIEENCYEFLTKYKDFSKFIKSVDKIHKNDIKRSKDKEEEP